MKSQELTKKDVLHLLQVWKQWIADSEPAKNKPDELKKWCDNKSNNLKIILSMALHLYLWVLRKIGAIFGIPSLIVWASKASIKIDYLSYEPLSCRYTNAYSDMGLGYLKMGKVEDAINCLKKSWRVYPCPHNTSFGLKLKVLGYVLIDIFLVVSGFGVFSAKLSILSAILFWSAFGIFLSDLAADFLTSIR